MVDCSKFADQQRQNFFTTVEFGHSLQTDSLLDEQKGWLKTTELLPYNSVIISLIN